MENMQTMKEQLERIAPQLTALSDERAYYLAGYVACAVDMTKTDEKKPADKGKAN